MPPEFSDPLGAAGEIEDVLDLLARRAAVYLDELDSRNVREPGADEAALAFDGPLPENGAGAVAALTELLERGPDATVTSAGPRFFHWVIGGVTPAALGADWATTLFDQNAGGWDASPLATQLELVSLRWLAELFRLPPDWSGVLTTGATMANFTGLAAARQWWAEEYGVDVSASGFAGLPPPPVLSSGHIHVSARKALAMLGMGREAVRTFAANPVGDLDVAALANALGALGGAPAIIVANAGEVNAGHFDPIADMAELADRHNAWLHVDGAFGLFARISGRTAHLAAGIERADSVISDGHKWLNVPYDNGFAFVRDGAWLPKAFTAVADYLPDPDARPTFAYWAPEMSRRARGLAIWATLQAYGRAGYQAMVERNLDGAQQLAALVDAAPDMERLADVPLNIVCFRYRPPAVAEDRLDALNARLGEAIMEDGRVYVGTTQYGGRTALRPAIVNWRTASADIDVLFEVIVELARGLAA